MCGLIDVEEVLKGRWGGMQQLLDIAEAVVYVMEARHVIGEVLHVDGGAQFGKW